MEFLDLLIQFFTRHGYLAVFAVLMICSLGIPFPEDITLVAGGVIAGLGYADVRIMCGVGLAGVLFGDSLMFLVGRYLGVRAMRLRWVAVLLTPQRYVRYRLFRCYIRFYSRADVERLAADLRPRATRIHDIGREYNITIDV